MNYVVFMCAAIQVPFRLFRFFTAAQKHFSVCALAEVANDNTKAEMFEMKIFTVTMCNRISFSLSLSRFYFYPI